MSIHIDAVIQARLGSTRLPGKSLLPVGGRPLLGQIVARVRHSWTIDRVIVATSDSETDDPIVKYAAEVGIACFRGSEEDVIGRVRGALDAFEVDVHVELQGDNAVPDARVIDSVVAFYLKHRGQTDYVTTGLRTTFPPGSEVSVYSAEVLRMAEENPAPGIPREHVGAQIYRQPHLFRSHNIEAPPHLHAPDVHLEVDTPEDLEVVREIYDHFQGLSTFSLGQAIEFARSSGLWTRNKDVPRRWRTYRQD